jgi:outer membrane protein OmpA-like peptidoglycan-associated protein
MFLETLGVIGWLFAAAGTAGGEINAAAYLSGARQVNEEGGVLNEVFAALDGDPKTQWEPSIEEVKPIILELAEPYDLSAIELINSSNEADYPGISVKELKIEVGSKPQGPWKTLASPVLSKGTKPVRFPVLAAKARYFRVTLIKNYGNAEWFGLGELRLLGQRSNPRTIEFNGVWDTDYGEMRLDQKGLRITGCYSNSAGEEEEKVGLNTVEGTFEGSIFSGVWRERSPDEPENYREGGMAFALTQEGNISGIWGGDITGKDRNQRWDGKRKSKGKITCERPEKDIGAELRKKGRVVLHGILFDTNQDVIRAESIPVLEALAAAMKADGARRFRIEGHTDNRGGDAQNQTLSEKRAARVKAWLSQAGIDVKRLDTKGFGLTQPVLSNDSEAGRAANRRVEVVAVP